MKRGDSPLLCCQFSPCGRYLGFASGEDWSQNERRRGLTEGLFLYTLQPGDVAVGKGK